MATIDSNHQYRQDELPGDIFNSSNGDVKMFNGQQVRVMVNNNGTRTIQPLSPEENAMRLAADAQNMQVQANQPAIATLNTQKNDLGTQYDTLLKSITEAEQPALNSVITATNNELGRRGITGDSGIGQSQIAQAQLPVTTQFGQLTASTGVKRSEDLGQIASQIAQLQTGNVPGALSFASGIAGQQEQLQAAQIAANAQVQSANAYANPTNYVVPAGGNLINSLSGKATSGNSFSPSPLGASFTPGNTPAKAAPVKPSLSTFVRAPSGISGLGVSLGNNQPSASASLR